jgi:lambda family phage portal protein
LLDESPGDLGGEGWRRPQHLWDTGWYVIRPVSSRFDPRQGRWLPARDVLHWFRADRPGQVRGVPEITAALPLFAQLRRYTLAVLASAETSADFAVMLESTLEPDRELDPEAPPFDMKEIDPRMLVALPTGYKAYQLKAEQPATTYSMFKQEILGEIARALNIPSNLAAGNFNNSSYASGRHDHQHYRRSLKVEQAGCEHALLDHLVRAWLEEAALVPELLPKALDLVDLRCRWLWDGWESIDPLKEAQAAEIKLRNGLMSWTEWFANQGRDPEEAFLEMAHDKAKRAELGLSGAAAPAASGPPEEDEDEDDTEEKEPEEEGAHAAS